MCFAVSVAVITGGTNNTLSGAFPESGRKGSKCENTVQIDHYRL